jgi:hypothetical protein
MSAKIKISPSGQDPCPLCGKWERHEHDLMDRADHLADRERLLALLRQAVEAMDMYGEHRADCNADLSEGDDIYPCTCGMTAALSACRAVLEEEAKT